MKGIRYTVEQIIVKLREAEIHVSQGKSVSDAVREIEISEATYTKWRSKVANMTTSDAKHLKDLEIENGRLKRLVADLSLDNAILRDVNFWKTVNQTRQKEITKYVCQNYSISERRACLVLGYHRRTIRVQHIIRDDEDELTNQIIELATRYGRYGVRRITVMLTKLGFDVNHKRVERIWKENGLKVPKKQPKRKRLWLNDGSWFRLRPEYKNHVWSYDFVTDQLVNQKKIRWLNIIDEYSRVCIFSEPRVNWTHQDIMEVLADCFILHGIPTHMRSDNGPEFIVKELIKWFSKLGINTSFIEPGSPWENGYCESFNSKLRDEFLNLAVFSSLTEAKALTKQWILVYNTVRPQCSLHYKAPAPLTIQVNRA